MSGADFYFDFEMCCSVARLYLIDVLDSCWMSVDLRLLNCRLWELLNSGLNSTVIEMNLT